MNAEFFKLTGESLCQGLIQLHKNGHGDGPLSEKILSILNDCSQITDGNGFQFLIGRYNE